MAWAMRSHGSRGFTLLELMFASAFMLIGFAAVLTMETAASQQQAQAEHQNRASQLAAGTLALCQLLPSATVVAMGTPVVLNYDVKGQPTSAAGAGPAFFAVTSSAAVASSVATKVNVSVQWTEPANRQVRTVTAEEIVATP